MKWEDIDRKFKDYERLCRKPPTTDELGDGILKAIEDTRELFKGYDVRVEQTKLEEFDNDV